MGANTTAETLALLKAAQDSSDDSIRKNFVQPGSATSGLQAYNLEPAAKTLYPVLTPLRNRLPRVGGGFATQANWKVITGINASNVRAGVSEGQRGGQVSHTTADYLATFRGIGLEKSVTFEADYAAKGFADLRALASLQTLQSLMIREEGILLGGNTSLALGVTPTPTLVAGSGGSLASGTLSVVCVALGNAAYWDVAGANNGNTGQSLSIASAQIPYGNLTRTNADGTTDTFGGGCARKSAAATVSVSASGKVTASIAAVRGAYAYAWFWGASGSEVLGAVTTVATVEISANAAGAQTAASLGAVDGSASALEFDGLLTQIVKPGSGGYFADGAGAALTSDGSGGVLQFDAAFADMWDRMRLGPQEIHMNARDAVAVSRLIVAGGGAPLLRLNMDVSGGDLKAGVRVSSYLNKWTQEDVQIVIHPNMPPGTFMFYSSQVPAYVDGYTTMARVLTRQDYYQIEWPLRTRKYEYGVYADEVLQCYMPQAFGVLTNVKTSV